jgi:hypothetical protein
VRCARRCPVCLRYRMVAIGEVIPAHALPSRKQRSTGDFWCGGGGLKLVAVKPQQWERVRDSDLRDKRI